MGHERAASIAIGAEDDELAICAVMPLTRCSSSSDAVWARPFPPPPPQPALKAVIGGWGQGGGGW